MNVKRIIDIPDKRKVTGNWIGEKKEYKDRFPLLFKKFNWQFGL
ncbi:2962_t:CDS:1, partial [Entrophospora sp. SA101]